MIQKNKVVLFVGAGVSREAGLTSGWELAEKLATEINYTPRPGDTLGTIAEYYDRTFPGQIVNYLVEWLDQGAVPGPSHQLIPLFQWRAIYTTNFDQLLERGYDERSKPFHKILYNQQLSNLSDNLTTIIKLHGCLSDAHRYSKEAPIMLTDKDFEGYLPTRQALVLKLKQHLLEGNTILFLGYSLRDPFWHDLRKDVATILRQQTRSYYAVLPNFSPQLAEYWNSRNIRLIRGTAHSFLKTLLNFNRT